MASPTPNKGYTYPAHGGSVNAWDTPLNADFDAIDLNLGGTYLINLGAYGAATYNSTFATIPSTASAITLATSLAQNLHYSISGTISNNMNLTFPSAFAGIVDITNAATGAFTVTTSVSGSTAAATTVGRGSQVFISDMTTMLTGDTNGVQSYLGNPNGNVAGTAATVNGGLNDMIWDVTDQILYFCTTTGTSSTAVWSVPVASVSRGLDTAVNLSLAVTHTGFNLLQIAAKTVAGADPTAGSPIICEFQTLAGTNTTGGVTSVSVTSALSMTSNAVGATLGTTNNVPFRFWIALFNNAGTAVLAIMNASTSTKVLPIAEYGVASTVSISGGATSAGVWYTPNGTTLSSKAYRLIGYCEYTSGLATSGTYTSDPSNAVIFSPGIKKPGDVVQISYGTTTTPTTSTGSTPTQTNSLATITPTSPINLVRVKADGWLASAAGQTGGWAVAQLSRGAGPTVVGNLAGVYSANTNAANQASVSMFVLDAPATTSATNYYVYTWANLGNSVWLSTSVVGINTGVIQAEEIMG